MKSRMIRFAFCLQVPPPGMTKEYRSRKIAGLWQVFSRLYGDSFCKINKMFFDLYMNGFISEVELRKYLVYVYRDSGLDGVWNRINEMK